MIAGRPVTTEVHDIDQSIGMVGIKLTLKYLYGLVLSHYLVCLKKVIPIRSMYVRTPTNYLAHLVSDLCRDTSYHLKCERETTERSIQRKTKAQYLSTLENCHSPPSSHAKAFLSCKPCPSPVSDWATVT